MAKLSTIDNDNFRNINTNFRQRFDASTNALQVLHGQDLSDKIAIVTGANQGGIGYEIARTLGRSGCSVIFACRDFAKAECAVGKVRSERPNVKCYPMHLDLASLKSVRSFASAFQVGWPNIRFLPASTRSVPPGLHFALLLLLFLLLFLLFLLLLGSL
jgi:hypothetical protein